MKFEKLSKKTQKIVSEVPAVLKDDVIDTLDCMDTEAEFAREVVLYLKSYITGIQNLKKVFEGIYK